MKLQYLIMLIWIVGALLSGLLEAIYFHRRDKNKSNKIKGLDIHVWLSIPRIILGLVLCYITYTGQDSTDSTLKLLNLWIMVWSFIFVFPFFHDGMYYTTRELLKKGTYPLYWADQSKTTTAIFSFSFFNRTIFFIGVLLNFPY